jgi:hypothetical protein
MTAAGLAATASGLAGSVDAPAIQNVDEGGATTMPVPFA